MKKKTVLMGICILLVLLIGGGTLLLFKSSLKCGLLKINGVNITQENVVVHSNYAELPLVAVMKSLDVKVVWVDTSIAEVMCGGKTYVLNLSEISLVEIGGSSNLLLPPPGGKRFHTVLDQELVLDSNTVKSTMYQLGIKVYIDINCREQIVCINTKTETQGDGSLV